MSMLILISDKYKLNLDPIVLTSIVKFINAVESDYRSDHAGKYFLGNANVPLFTLHLDQLLQVAYQKWIPINKTIFFGAVLIALKAIYGQDSTINILPEFARFIYINEMDGVDYRHSIGLVKCAFNKLGCIPLDNEAKTIFLPWTRQYFRIVMDVNKKYLNDAELNFCKSINFDIPYFDETKLLLGDTLGELSRHNLESIYIGGYLLPLAFYKFALNRGNFSLCAVDIRSILSNTDINTSLLAIDQMAFVSKKLLTLNNLFSLLSSASISRAVMHLMDIESLDIKILMSSVDNFQLPSFYFNFINLLMVLKILCHRDLILPVDTKALIEKAWKTLRIRLLETAFDDIQHAQNPSNFLNYIACFNFTLNVVEIHLANSVGDYNLRLIYKCLELLQFSVSHHSNEKLMHRSLEAKPQQASPVSNTPNGKSPQAEVKTPPLKLKTDNLDGQFPNGQFKLPPLKRKPQRTTSTRALSFKRRPIRPARPPVTAIAKAFKLPPLTHKPAIFAPCSRPSQETAQSQVTMVQPTPR